MQLKLLMEKEQASYCSAAEIIFDSMDLHRASGYVTGLEETTAAIDEVSYMAKKKGHWIGRERIQ